MPRQTRIALTLSAVAIAASCLLTACHQSNQHKTAATQPSATTSATTPTTQQHTHTQAARPAAQPAVAKQTAPTTQTRSTTPNQPTALPTIPAPQGQYLLAIDAGNGHLAQVGNNHYVLALPLNSISHVARFYPESEQAPTYLSNADAQAVWANPPASLFNNTHAILSSHDNNPQTLTLMGEITKRNAVLLNLQTNQSFNGNNLHNVVLTIRGNN